jgi:cell cycle checkpoint protein
VKSLLQRLVLIQAGFRKLPILITLSWSSIDDASTSSASLHNSVERDLDRGALFSRFEAFINRASSCQNLFTAPGAFDLGKESFHRSQSIQSSQPGTSSQCTRRPPKQRLILLEELPNILHSGVQAKFHAALQSLVLSPPTQPPVPIVVIVSNAGTRGEASDERMASGSGWGKDGDAVVDIRTVLGRDLLSGPYVTQIGYEQIPQSYPRLRIIPLIQV